MRLLLLALVITFLSNTGFSGTDYSKDLEHKDGIVVIDDMARDHIVGAGYLSVLLEAGAEAVTNSYDEIVGIRLYEIEPGSIYDLVGLRDEDIITMVDGQYVTGITHMLNLAEDLKRRSTFSFMVSRKIRGKLQDVSFKIIVK